VIETGTAEVSVGGDSRRKLGPGDYFGEIALLSQAARSATVTAETPLQCWGLTSWAFARRSAVAASELPPPRPAAT